MKYLITAVAWLALSACGGLIPRPDAGQPGDVDFVDSGMDAGVVDAGSSTPDSGTAEEDGGSDAGLDAGNMDAGTHGGPGCSIVPNTPASDPGLVSCGNGPTTCDVDGGIVCCTQGGNGPLSGTSDCRLPVSCDAMNFRVCDEAADCPGGQVCCFTYGGGTSTYREVLTTCMAKCPFGHYNQACKTDQECGTGNACITYDTNGYRVSTCVPPSPSCH